MKRISSVVVIACAVTRLSLGAQLSDGQAKTIIETEWNFTPVELIRLGKFDVIGGLLGGVAQADPDKGSITEEYFKILQAYARVGVIAVDEDRAYKDFLSGKNFSWNQWGQASSGIIGRIMVRKTARGDQLGRSTSLPQKPTFLIIPQGRFNITTIVKSEPRSVGSEDCRLIMATYDAAWTPEYKQRAELMGDHLDQKRKTRTLLAFDPFQTKWKLVAADCSNMDTDFATDSVSGYLNGDRSYLAGLEALHKLLGPSVPIDVPLATLPSTPSATAAWSVASVCAGATLGQFRHGTKCTSFYETDTSTGKLKLVDIQLAGKESSKAYTKTKSLVHPGIDLLVAEGTPIHAAANGTVDDVILSPNDENFGSLGYMVIVEHSEKVGGKPIYSLYLHMKERPKVTVGQSVKAGDTVLGLVGSTGAAFGPHVHFELRQFAGRFFPKWKNIYGIERPKDEATFDEADFSGNWLDPENPAGVKAPAGSRSEAEGQTSLAAPTLPAPEKRTGTWAWSTTSRITRQGQVTTLNYEHTLNMAFTGNSVTGTLETASPDGHRAVREITDGTAKGDDFIFTTTSTLSNGRKITTKYSGRLLGDTIKGKIESESNGQSRANDWEASKKSPGQPPIPGPTTGSSDPLALEQQLKELIARPARVPDSPDKVLSDEKQGVTVSYPAAFEVRRENRPVVAFFLAPSGAEPEQNRPKISVTCRPMPLLSRNASLESVADNTIAGTKSALANAAVTGLFQTTLAGVRAQTFIVTGTEEGVVRQKAVTIAICRKHILGVVLHATPETFPKFWDDYKRVCDSYVLH